MAKSHLSFEQFHKGAMQLKARMTRIERGLGPVPCPKCGNSNPDRRHLGVSEDKLVLDVCGECGHEWVEELTEDGDRMH